MLFSVIIPIYNAAPWLDQCITSILESTADNPSGVELILVDDGSTDNSAAICQGYAQRYANIQLIRKDNGGVASARNAGLAVAEGSYIVWVDPDDYVSPQWYPAIRAAAEKECPDVIVMDMARFGQWGRQKEIYGRPCGFVDRDQFVEDVIRDIRMLSGLPNKVIKAELYKGIQFDQKLPILEDFAVLPDILRSVETVYYLPQCLYNYRQHEDSLLHHVTPERAFLSIQIAMRRVEIVEQQFRRAAVTAVCCQMLTFCRNRYIFEDFFPEREQTLFCKKYIRQHLLTPLLDSEVPYRVKMGLFSLAVGTYGLLAVFLNRRRSRVGLF